VTPTAELQLIRADHAPALLAFEVENRAYFAASVPDRGDAYFAHFSARHQELLAEQAAGVHLFHVLGRTWRPDNRERVNLFDIDRADGSADLGYTAWPSEPPGTALATAGVHQVCELAVTRYGLVTLHARCRTENAAISALSWPGPGFTTGRTDHPQWSAGYHLRPAPAGPSER